MQHTGNFLQWIILLEEVWCWKTCVLCVTLVKNADHLLSHCPVAVELWNFIFVALGDTNNGRNIASASALKFQDFQEKSLEHYTWCLTWNAWRDRNGSTFEE